MLGRLPIRRVGSARPRPRSSRFGTVFWYAAQLGDDVVPGPRPGGRRCCCSRSGSRWARTGTRRSTRTTCRTPTTPTSSRSARAALPGSSAGRRARPARPRPPPGPRRPPVRAGLHGPAHGRVRRAVLPARRRRRLVAARGWSAALGAAIPIGGAARSTTWSRPGSLIQPGYQYLYELEASFYRPRLPPRLGDRGPPLHPAESRDHAAQHAGRSCRTSFPAGLGDGQVAVHRRRARSAACSTPTARSPCRATSG